MDKVKEFKSVQDENRQKRIDSILNFKGFTGEQSKLVKRFYDYLIRSGLSLESRRGYLQQLKLLILTLKKDFNKLNKKDIDNYLAHIEKKYKDKTAFERRLFLIKFFPWYFDKDRDEIDLIKGMNLKKPNGTKLPEDMLSPDQIKKMVQVADNFRDKAIAILLYESAARKSEFLQLKIKHVNIVNKEYGYLDIPRGKTDSRRIPIIYSVPHIQNWLNAHPMRDNRDAPLFVTAGAWLGRAMGEDGLKRLLKVLSYRAFGGVKEKSIWKGHHKHRVIPKINIYPHLLRHSRLTELAKELTEQELKKFAGWTPNSNMAAIYVHLSGKDVSDKILANAGLIDVEEVKKNEKALRSIKCPRCGELNPPDNKYCKCGFVLDLKEANKLMDSDNKKEQAIQDKMQTMQMQIAELLKDKIQKRK